MGQTFLGSWNTIFKNFFSNNSGVGNCVTNDTLIHIYISIIKIFLLSPMVDHIGGWSGTDGGASAYYFDPTHSGGLSQFNAVMTPFFLRLP